MRFPRVKISSNKGRKSSSAALQNGERKIDGGGGTNSRQVAPETHLHFGSVDYGNCSFDFCSCFFKNISSDGCANLCFSVSKCFMHLCKRTTRYEGVSFFPRSSVEQNE